jgi:hypothetical protein
LFLDGHGLRDADARRLLRLRSVAIGKIAAAEKAEGEKDDFFALEKDLVDALVKALDLKLSSSREAGSAPTRPSRSRPGRATAPTSTPTTEATPPRPGASSRQPCAMGGDCVDLRGCGQVPGSENSELVSAHQG